MIRTIDTIINIVDATNVIVDTTMKSVEVIVFNSAKLNHTYIFFFKRNPLQFKGTAEMK